MALRPARGVLPHGLGRQLSPHPVTVGHRPIPGDLDGGVISVTRLRPVLAIHLLDQALLVLYLQPGYATFHLIATLVQEGGVLGVGHFGPVDPIGVQGHRMRRRLILEPLALAAAAPPVSLTTLQGGVDLGVAAAHL